MRGTGQGRVQGSGVRKGRRQLEIAHEGQEIPVAEEQRHTILYAEGRAEILAGLPPGSSRRSLVRQIAFPAQFASELPYPFLLLEANQCLQSQFHRFFLGLRATCLQRFFHQFIVYYNIRPHGVTPLNFYTHDK
jgi:hypothetical protein